MKNKKELDQYTGNNCFLFDLSYHQYFFSNEKLKKISIRKILGKKISKNQLMVEKQ